MHTQIVPVQTLLSLLGTEVHFSSDSVFMVHEGRTYYNWRSGDPCRVVGFASFDRGQYSLQVSHGSPDALEIEDIPLDQVYRQLTITDRPSRAALSALLGYGGVAPHGSQSTH